MTSPQNVWSEQDSELYRELAVAVPAREEQIAALVALVPFGRGEGFRVVELGCGEGDFSSTGQSNVILAPQGQAVAQRHHRATAG